MATGAGWAVRIGRLLSTYEWLFLGFLLPFALFPTPARAPLLLLIPLLWLARKVGHGRYVPATPFDWTLFGLLLMVLVSLYATFDISFSIGKIAGMVFGVAVFYATVAFVADSVKRLWLGVGALMASELGVVALSLLGGQWPRKFPLFRDLIGRLPPRLLTLPGAATGFSSNELAGVLLWIAPLALVLALLSVWEMGKVRGQARLWLHILLSFTLIGMAALFSGTLLLSQSRGGLLGLGVGFMAMLLAAAWRMRRWLPLALFVAAAGISVLVATSIGVDEVKTMLFDQVGVSNGGGAIGTLEGRLEIWSRALYGIQDFPFTGMGMNNFRRVVHILYPLFLIPPDKDIAHAHNYLLQAALDLGIPGLIAYLALWLGAAVLLWQVWGQTESPWLKWLALGMAGSLLSHFMYGMTDAVALGAKPGFIFWLLLGLVVSLHQIVQRETAASGSGMAAGEPGAGQK